MASLTQRLIEEGDASPSRMRSAVSVGTTRSSLGDDTPSRRWTVSLAGDKDLQGVSTKEVSDLASARGHAKYSTQKALTRSSSTLGLLHQQSTRLIGLTLKNNKAPEGNGIKEESSVSLDDGVEKQTNSEAVVNLLNNCLGSGMLGIGFAFSQAGVLVGIALMATSALLNRFTTHLNIKTCQLVECDPSTTAIGEKTFGPAGRTLLVGMYTSVGFFCMVSYCDATADAVQGLLALVVSPASLPSHKVLTIICWAMLLFPPTLIRSLKGVAVMSFMAFTGGLILLILVVILCGGLLATNGLPAFGAVKLVPTDAASFLTAFPILLLIFNIQAGGTMILANIEEPTEDNQRMISASGLTIAAVMDLILGCVTYLTFLDAIQSDVLNSFPTTNPIAILARVAVLDLVVLSYVIMIIPCKISILDLVFGKNEANQEASKVQFYGTTFVLNVLALVVALSVSDLAIVLGLCGAIAGPFTSMLMPCTFYMKAKSIVKEGDSPTVPMFSFRNAPYWVLNLLGLSVLCFCTFQVVQRMTSA